MENEGKDRFDLFGLFGVHQEGICFKLISDNIPKLPKYVRECDKCHAGLRDSDLYCPSCGTKLVSSEYPYRIRISVCGQCGAQVGYKQRYCRICGKKL